MQPELRVGLVTGRKEARIGLQDAFTLEVDGREVGVFPRDTELRFVVEEGQVALRPGDDDLRGARLVLLPQGEGTFVLRGMTVGVDFHWQHDEDLSFEGGVSVEASARGLDVVNVVALEGYLVSVISSEMSARCPPALLRAHAVISRSWLLAQLEGAGVVTPSPTEVTSEGDHLELVRWYDREDHDTFDVCADDHCQRYHGVTRAISPEAAAAVSDTRGLVLTERGLVCDARFSKCCGGITELFESCWGPEPKGYLQSFPDGGDVGPLDDEETATAFITGAPPAYCNTRDRDLLERLLPDLDHATHDFYRWEVTVTAEQVRAWVLAKVGVDLGEVKALQPLARGPSGRLTRLAIEGAERVLHVGKELEIRRLLSDSHLYSSAFVVTPVEGGFHLRGAGWGHGVGLCQIGAAVMAAEEHDHESILAHYYRGAELERRY